MSAASELLGPQGRLASVLPGYEVRAGQITMAEAVERSLASEHTLVCEAGTGTGKTLAYLVPAALSGRKVVISTATRALQEQLVSHDVPLLERALGRSIDVAVMKGLGNYLCRRRWSAVRDANGGREGARGRALQRVEEWLQDTTHGDVSELTALDEDDPLLPQITSSSETRVGQGCAHFDECFVTRMRRRADAARIVIVNHHLYFADLALRGPHPGRVLPEHDAIVFDEAHQLEDVATSFFGLRVGQARVEHLARDVERALAALGLGGPQLTSALPGSGSLGEVRVAADALFVALARHGGDDGRAPLERDVWSGAVARDWHRLDAALEVLGGLAETARARASSRSLVPAQRNAGVADTLDGCVRRAQSLREDLGRIADGERGYVTWVERSARGIAVGASPVDVADLLRTRVFEVGRPVIVTSATLATGSAAEPGQDRPKKARRASASRRGDTTSDPDAPRGDTTSDPDAPRGDTTSDPDAPRGDTTSDPDAPRGDDEPVEDEARLDGRPRLTGPFRFLRSRLGLFGDHVAIDELVVPSPFDFERRALLYTPRDLPSPGDPRFVAAAAARSEALIRLTAGGAFVLTTSVRSMRAICRELRTRLGSWRVLLQGEAPKSALLAEFKSAGDAVLVATQSFWEGVDVPGNALRLVVLEKIPFVVPSDPIYRARSLALEEQGGNPFMDLAVPAAALALKQGFGRLIRTQSDAGIVALFDERVHRRGYGKRLLGVLPPARRSDDLAEVATLWRALDLPDARSSVRA